MAVLFHRGVLVVAGAVLVTIAILNAVQAREVALTKDNVSRFLASFGEMRLIAISEGLSASADPAAKKNPLAAVLKAIETTKLRKEAQIIVARYGFANVSEWLDTGRAIGQAYVYITVGPNRGIAKSTLDKHRDNAAREIEKLSILTEKQKKKLLERIDEASDQLSREPPKGNVAVVEEMKPQIEAAVKIPGR